MAKTIKQLAEVCGVSEQAIRAWCRKNQVPKVAKGNGFAINETTEMAILLHYGAISTKDAKENESSNESSSETRIMLEILQKELDFCRSQLEEKDKQLRVKDSQIVQLNERLAESQKLIDQQQQLNAIVEQKLSLLEKKEDEPPAEQPKRHWWNFGKNKGV